MVKKIDLCYRSYFYPHENFDISQIIGDIPDANLSVAHSTKRAAVMTSMSNILNLLVFAIIFLFAFPWSVSTTYKPFLRDYG
jgi:hypothetical protein